MGFYIAAMLSSTATTTIDRDETEELGKALGLDFALTFLFLPRPFASANKPAEEDPPEKVLLDAKKIDLNLIKKEFDEEGKLSDGMSGMRLSYFGARYYDAEIGVWGSTDPAGQYWNAYLYCSGNPVVNVDPNGELAGMFFWGIDRNGLTVGWQWGGAAHYGFYSRFDWGSKSFSTGVTAGVGKDLYGVKLGASAQLGTTYGVRSGQWSQDGSLGVNAGYSTDKGYGFGLGANTSISYSYNSGKLSPIGGSVSAGPSYSGTQGDVNASVSYGGGGWGYGVNGSVQRREEIEGLTVHRIEPGAQDNFGHYWIEIDGTGYGYWPDKPTNAEQAILMKHTGSVKRETYHKGDRSGKNYKVYGPKGAMSEDYRAQMNNSFYRGNLYGVPWGRNCQTFQRDFIQRNDLYIVSE